MNLKYMPEMDTLYIYLEADIPKIMIPSDIDERVGIFVDKKTKKTLCGYEIEGAKDFLFSNLNKLELSLKQKIAVGLYFIRILKGLSQETMANEINVSLSTYKYLEKAENNLTFDTFEMINSKFPMVAKVIGKSLLAS
jgi:uncharacterized protein YuzE